MLQAYLRGLLEPGYSHGVHSQLRERMLLDALSSEQQEKDLLLQTMAGALIMAPGNLKPESRRKLISMTFKHIEEAALVRSVDWDGVEQHRFENSSLAASKVYDLLSQAGLVGDKSEQK